MKQARQVHCNGSQSSLVISPLPDDLLRSRVTVLIAALCRGKNGPTLLNWTFGRYCGTPFPYTELLNNDVWGNCVESALFMPWSMRSVEWDNRWTDTELFLIRSPSPAPEGLLSRDIYWAICHIRIPDLIIGRYCSVGCPWFVVRLWGKINKIAKMKLFSQIVYNLYS